jgi:hypothetical protein
MKIKMLLRKKKKLSRRITTARVSGLAATRAVDRRLLETLFRRRHMPNNESAAPKSYDRAREMTEKALGVFVEGDEKTGAKLVEQAKGVSWPGIPHSWKTSTIGERGDRGNRRFGALLSGSLNRIRLEASDT